MLLFWFIVSVALLILMISKLKVHAFLSLLAVSLFFGICAGIPLAELPGIISGGFGNTMSSIGIVMLWAPSWNIPAAPSGLPTRF